MAYSKIELKEKAIQVINEYNLLFIEDIFTFVPYNKATFYRKNLNKDKEILEALNNNKVNTKHNLRAKWYKSNNATLQVALYKLICNDEELERLQPGNKVNIQQSGAISNHLEGVSKEDIEKELDNLYTGEDE